MACKALWSQKEVVSNLLKSRLSLFKWVLGSNPYFRSMISILKWRNWLLVKVLVLISILVPVGITAYESIAYGKDSVVFLEGYPSTVGIVVVLYYSLLLLAGLVWVVMQVKSLMELKNEKTKNELLHLQNQVNPHFFFNMLNNIYGMVDRDTEKAKEIILKLSDLMRYSIYEGEKTIVSLSEEITFLKNYIDLHKMRYHKTIDVQFNTDMDRDADIPPLLLIILIENAFKHGVEHLRENAYVHIDLTVKNDTLDFKIENNFDEDEVKKNKGIGIKNLKRRLQLLYPNRYQLNFTESNAIHKARLTIQL